MVKTPSANSGDIRDSGSIPGLGRYPGEGNGNPVFLLGEFHRKRSLMDTVHRVTESDITEAT